MDRQDITNRFEYHPPSTESVKNAHETVRATLLNATLDLGEFLPECRETSLFVTKMEEAMMWANAAIARKQDL